MTRKHYRAVAQIIKDQMDEWDSTPGSAEIIASVARRLAESFKEENRQFRYDFFFKACGLDSWGHPVLSEVVDP